MEGEGDPRYLVGLFWLLVVTCFLVSASAIKYLTEK